MQIGGTDQPAAPGGAGGGAAIIGRDPGGGPNPAFDDCLAPRFRELRASFTAPLQTIQQIVDPPSTDITSQSYTAAASTRPSRPWAW